MLAMCEVLSGCRPTGDVAFADRSGGSAAGAGTVHDEEGWCDADGEPKKLAWQRGQCLHAALNVGDNEVGVASIALDMSRHATLLMLTAHQYTHQQPHREATIGQQPLPPCILAWRLWCS